MKARFPLAMLALYVWAFISLALTTDLHPLAAAVLPLAAAAFWLRERWPMSKRNGVIAIGVALVVAMLVSQGATSSGYLLGVGSLSFAMFAASTLVAFTLLRPTEETRLAIPGLCGFLLVTCSMSLQIKLVALIGLPGTLLLALAFRERQGLPLSWRLVPPIALMIGITLALAFTARWSETRLSYLMNLFSMIPASGLRFPPSSGLSSLQRSNFSDVVVLRIYGDVAPPYLIGRTFTNFDDRFWQWKPTKKEIPSQGTVPSPITGKLLQVFPDQPNTSAPRLESPVYVEFPDGGSGFTLYTPRYFSALATDLERLHRYSDGLWQVLAQDSFSGIYVLYPYTDGWVRQGPPEELSAEELAKHLALPEKLTPEIARLAEEVAGRFEDPAEKVRRITTLFHTQFEYGYDFPFESEETALEEFLLKRPAAHCEFFATATALMLRSQGVPTRYINGFVVQERSLDNTYFVVRLKHAHAWLEAYLPGQGWTTVDPTPPGVLEEPNTPNSSRLRAVLEHLSNSWRQLIAWLRMSPTDMLQRARSFLGSRSGSEVLMLLGLVAAGWGVSRWWKGRRRRPGRSHDIPFVAGRHPRLTPALERLEGAANPPQWRRHNWETPLQWAARLALSDLPEGWLERLRTVLERYGQARYGERSDDSEIALIEAELEELRVAFEGKSLQPRERPRA
jgi:transglutaminase-like putative cysteine protease